MSTVAEMLKDPKTTPDTVLARGRRIVLKRLTEIATLPVRWLWKHRIATGMFGLFPGREGLGKSLVVFDLVAKITRGTLEGDDFGTPRKVLICATEDSFAHTVVPRLIAANADLQLVAKIDVMADDREDELVLPVDLDELSKEIIANNVALVVLDPLLPRLAAKLDTHKDADVRRALEPLTKLAEITGAAVLGIIHVNKSSGSDPLNSIMGSRAFSAVARYTIFIAPDPEDDSIRLIGQAKNNVGPSDSLPLLPFRIEPFTFRNNEQVSIETARVEWLKADTTRTLRQVLRDNHDGRKANPREEAEAWLKEYLSACDGQRALSQDVKADAEKAGHKDRTLKRAATALRVSFPKDGKQTWWLLPAQKEIPF